MGEKINAHNILVKKREGNIRLVKPRLDGRTLLTWTAEMCGVKMWTELLCLSESNGDICEQGDQLFRSANSMGWSRSCTVSSRFACQTTTAICENRRLITVSTRGGHCTLFWDRWIQFVSSFPTGLWSTLMSSFHLRQLLQNSPLLSSQMQGILWLAEQIRTFQARPSYQGLVSYT